MRGYVMIRQHPQLRQDAFVAGLKAAGFEPKIHAPDGSARPGDVLVLWNGHFGIDEHIARRFERMGGTLLVAENAYVIGAGEKWQRFAIAEGGHNGSGWSPTGGPERWAELRQEIRPWRANGSHVVVFAQRGIGSAQMASPRGWERDVSDRLRKITSRHIVVSFHPGKPGNHPMVVDQTRELLRGAHVAVIWSSSRGVRALIEGVPVIYQAPHWICESAASNRLEDVENPPMGNRQEAFERMAWAQWSAEEVASGIAFQKFIEHRRIAA